MKVTGMLRAVLLLTAIFLFTLTVQAGEDKQLLQTGAGTLVRAITADSCLGLVIRTQMTEGYREALIDLKGKHCFMAVTEEEFKKGTLFLLSADFYEDYNDGVKVGNPIVVSGKDKAERIKVYEIIDPYQKNIPGESKFITIDELAAVPCKFKNFRYGLSTDNELILVHEENNTVKVFKDPNNRHVLNQVTQIDVIATGKYQLVDGKKMPGGRIKIGK